MEKSHSGILRYFLLLILSSSITIINPVTTAMTTSQTTTNNPYNIQDISTVTTSIQEAINDAQPNSTIQIPNGIYTEILTINKPIHLQGEGTTKTFLCTTSPTNGYAIRITVQGVTLSDINITNKGLGLYTTCVKISAPNTRIQNCMFYDTPIGVAIWSSQNLISGCEFRGCEDEGIALLGTPTTSCTNNTITACTFYHNTDGIELQYATDNLITSCSFTDNTHADINPIKSGNNNVTNCKFTNKQTFDFFIATSPYNLIEKNSFSNHVTAFVDESDNALQKHQIKYSPPFTSSNLFIHYAKIITTINTVLLQLSTEMQTKKSEIIQEKNNRTVFYYLLLHRFISLRS